MECKNCGSKLTLDDEFCPYCGKRNEEAAKHIAYMKKYKTEFSKTKFKVIKESKWYSRYLAVMGAIVLAAVVNVFLLILINRSYDIQIKLQRFQNRIHEEVILDELKELEKEGEYGRMYILFQQNYYTSLKDAREYMPVMTAYYTKEKLAECLMYLSSQPILEARALNYDPGYYIEMTARYVKELYEIQMHEIKGVPEAYTGIHGENLIQIQSEVEMLLKTYLYFTDADLEGMGELKQYQIAELISRRLTENGENRKGSRGETE